MFCEACHHPIVIKEGEIVSTRTGLASCLSYSGKHETTRILPATGARRLQCEELAALKRRERTERARARFDR